MRQATQIATPAGIYSLRNAGGRPQLYTGRRWRDVTPSEAAHLMKYGRKKTKDSPGQQTFKWITLNADSGPDGDGGTRVAIDDDGNIGKGPDALTGRNLDSLDRDVAGTDKDRRKDATPPQDTAGDDFNYFRASGKQLRDKADNGDQQAREEINRRATKRGKPEPYPNKPPATNGGPTSETPKTPKEKPENPTPPNNGPTDEPAGKAAEYWDRIKAARNAGNFKEAGRLMAELDEWEEEQEAAKRKAPSGAGTSSDLSQIPPEPKTPEEKKQTISDVKTDVATGKIDEDAAREQLAENNTPLPPKGLNDNPQPVPPSDPQEKTQKKGDRVASRTGLQDFGEKIGGARKDTAKKTGKRAKAATEDDRPAWSRRYAVAQIAGSRREHENGKFVIQDTRKKSRWGGVVHATDKLFDTAEEAAQHVKHVEVARNHGIAKQKDGTFAIVRKVSDRKRPVVKGGFSSHDEALRHMAANPVDIIEHKTRIDDRIHPMLERIDRVGTDHRSGKDATPEQFAEFGLRGVEFGNWNNQKERQHVLNHAYDSFRDLADTLGVDPQALSLGGELGLAFGARGHGLQGARAHYEPEYAAINLTKLKGSGSLAHEWFHALDHYVSRRAGTMDSERKGTRKYKDQDGNDVESPVFKDGGNVGAMATHGRNYYRRNKETARDDVRDAMAQVMDAINFQEREYTPDVSQHDKQLQRAQKRLDQQLDSFRQSLTHDYSQETYAPFRGKKNRVPLPTDKLKQVDQLIADIKAGDTGEDVELPKTGRSKWSLPVVMPKKIAQLNAIYKAHRGRNAYHKDQSGRISGDLAYINSENSYRNTARKVLEEANAQVESGEKASSKVHSDFRDAAIEMDRGSAKDYWSTPHELGARAFESYVYDRIKENEGRNDFLAYEKHNERPEYKLLNAKPYPEGEQRKRINAAFDNLLSVLKTKEQEDPRHMYALRARDGRRYPMANIAGRPHIYSAGNWRPISRRGARQIIATLRVQVRPERYARKRKDSPGQQTFRWVTLNAGDDDGTRVQIDDHGNIGKGPDALTGKNLNQLDKDVSGTSQDKRKQNKPPKSEKRKKAEELAKQDPEIQRKTKLLEEAKAAIGQGPPPRSRAQEAQAELDTAAGKIKGTAAKKGDKVAVRGDRTGSYIVVGVSKDGKTVRVRKDPKDLTAEQRQRIKAEKKPGLYDKKLPANDVIDPADASIAARLEGGRMGRGADDPAARAAIEDLERREPVKGKDKKRTAQDTPPINRGALLAEIGLELNTGRANLETEQEVQRRLGVEDWSQVPRAVKSLDDEQLTELHGYVTGEAQAALDRQAEAGDKGLRTGEMSKPAPPDISAAFTADKSWADMREDLFDRFRNDEIDESQLDALIQELPEDPAEWNHAKKMQNAGPVFAHKPSGRGHIIGTITDVSVNPNNRSLTLHVKDAEGKTYKLGSDYVDSLGDKMAHDAQRGRVDERYLARPGIQNYLKTLAGQMSNDNPIDAVIRAAFGQLDIKRRMPIRKAISKHYEDLQEAAKPKPSEARARAMAKREQTDAGPDRSQNQSDRPAIIQDLAGGGGYLSKGGGASGLDALYKDLEQRSNKELADAVAWLNHHGSREEVAKRLKNPQRDDHNEPGGRAWDRWIGTAIRGEARRRLK